MSKDTFIHMRVTDAEKAAWEAIAQAEDISLSELIRRVLNERLAHVITHKKPVITSSPVPSVGYATLAIDRPPPLGLPEPQRLPSGLPPPPSGAAWSYK
jgi:hypothetical protein